MAKSNKLSKSELHDTLQGLRDDIAQSGSGQDLPAALETLREDLRNEVAFLSQLIKKQSEEHRAEVAQLGTQVAHEVTGLSQRIAELPPPPPPMADHGDEIREEIHVLRRDVGRQIGEVSQSVDTLRAKPDKSSAWMPLLAAAAALVIGICGTALFLGQQADSPADGVNSIQTAVAHQSQLMNDQASALRSLTEQLRQSSAPDTPPVTQAEIDQLTQAIVALQQAVKAPPSAGEAARTAVARPTIPAASNATAGSDPADTETADTETAGSDPADTETADTETADKVSAPSDQQQSGAAPADQAPALPDQDIPEVPTIANYGDSSPSDDGAAQASEQSVTNPVADSSASKASAAAMTDVPPVEADAESSATPRNAGRLLIKNRCPYEVELQVNGLAVKIPAGKMATMAVEPDRVKTQIGEFAGTARYWDKWSTVAGRQQMTIHVEADGDTYGLR